MSVNDTIYWIKEWCKIQSIDYNTFPNEFLTIILKPKAKDKRNCIYLEGNSNAAKTRIANFIKKLSVTYGEMELRSDYNFSYVFALNKRYVQIDEATIGQKKVDSFKSNVCKS